MKSTFFVPKGLPTQNVLLPDLHMKKLKKILSHFTLLEAFPLRHGSSSVHKKLYIQEVLFSGFPFTLNNVLWIPIHDSLAGLQINCCRNLPNHGPSNLGKRPLQYNFSMSSNKGSASLSLWREEWRNRARNGQLLIFRYILWTALDSYIKSSKKAISMVLVKLAHHFRPFPNSLFHLLRKLIPEGLNLSSSSEKSDWQVWSFLGTGISTSSHVLCFYSVSEASGNAFLVSNWSKEAGLSLKLPLLSDPLLP